MNGAARKLVVVARLATLRILREPASTVVMIGIPLALIPVMGSVFSRIGNWSDHLDGTANPMAFIAIGIVVLFQLFGGRFSMEAVRESLISEKRWRIHAAPCRPAIIAMGIIASSALIRLLQGVFLAAFARAALGVRWGNPAVLLVVLLGAGLVAQLAHGIILLAIRSYGAAVTLGWMFAWGSAALGGLIFPLPQGRPFWRFMTTYGTPYSLAQTALANSAGGGAGGAARQTAVCIGALFALSALLAFVLALLGRRKLS